MSDSPPLLPFPLRPPRLREGPAQPPRLGSSNNNVAPSRPDKFNLLPYTLARLINSDHKVQFKGLFWWPVFALLSLCTPGGTTTDSPTTSPLHLYHTLEFINHICPRVHASQSQTSGKNINEQVHGSDVWEEELCYVSTQGLPRHIFHEVKKKIGIRCQLILTFFAAHFPYPLPSAIVTPPDNPQKIS